MIKNKILVAALSLALFLSFGSLGTSYAYANYQTGDKVIVIVSKSPAYSTSSKSSKVVGYIYKGMVLSVLGQTGIALHVKSSTGKTGYIHADTVQAYQASAPTNPSTPTKPAPPASTLLGNRVVSSAMKYLGIPYKLGGDYNLDGSMAFDCSGFVKRVYSDVGVTLPRTATQQWNATKQNRVSLSNATKGDIVFFDLNKNGYIDHDALYIGNGKIIQASTANGGKVQITDLNQSTWWKSRVLYVTRVVR